MRTQNDPSADKPGPSDGDGWILAHLPLVRSIVWRLCGGRSWPPDEDLLAAGMLALVRAARRFDPARGTAFSTYAAICIRGAVTDELRARAPEPAGVHRRLRKLRQAGERHRVETGQSPDEAALGGDVGLTPQQVQRLLYGPVGAVRFDLDVNVHAPAASNGDQAEPSGPAGQAEHRELREHLAEAVRQLSARQRLVLMLYYERELTLDDVAETLGTTKGRVCQIHRQTLDKLSRQLRPSRAA